MKMKKILSYALVLAMLAGLLPGLSLTAWAVNPYLETQDLTSDGKQAKTGSLEITLDIPEVPYLDPTKTGTEQNAKRTQYWSVTDKTIAAIKDDTIELGSGANAALTWLAVDGNVTIDKPITVKGDANLILKDNANLTAQKDITIENNGSLTIYAQSKGDKMGTLTVGGVEEGSNGCIKAGENTKLVFNGGKVGVVTSQDAGIDSKGDVTVNGGSVNVIAEKQGISAGSITITDGKVGARASTSGITGTLNVGYGMTAYSSGTSFFDADLVNDLTKDSTYKAAPGYGVAVDESIKDKHMLVEPGKVMSEVKITSNQEDANLYLSTRSNTLTAVTNVDGVKGFNLGYQWYRGGDVITNATERDYTLTSNDVGKIVSVEVTDKNAPKDNPNVRTQVSTATPEIVTVAPRTYAVTITVKNTKADGTEDSSAVTGATVELCKGNTVYASTTQNTSGVYTLSVPVGEYSIVVTVGEKTKTETITVGENTNAKTVLMPYYNASSKVNVNKGANGDTPAAVVTGLDAVANDALKDLIKDMTTDEEKESVSATVTMTVETTADLTQMTAAQVAALPPEQKAVKQEQDAIKTLNKTLPASETKADEIEFIDLSLVLKTNNSAAETSITEITNALEILLPYETQGRAFQLFRTHNSTAKAFTPLPSRLTRALTAKDDGTFYVGIGYIVIYTNKFSTYAIGYSEESQPTQPTSSGKSSGSSGGGGGVVMSIAPVTVNATSYDKCGKDATCPIGAFSDADAAVWYHDGVHWALDNGVMKGVSKAHFNPNGSTSRAMVATMLWRLAGSPAVSGETSFADVKSGEWFADAVRWANANGIVTGYRDANGAGKVFNPNGAVTREQLATMLWRYAKYKGADVSVGEDTNILSYGDATSVSEYAVAATQWAVGAGVINGISGNLVPGGEATRAQVATMLMRYVTAK